MDTTGNQRRILIGGSLPVRGPARVGVHHYAEQFARAGWDVGYLCSQFSLLHLLRRRDRMFASEKTRLWRSGGARVGGIWHYAYMTWLPVLPFWTSEAVLRNTLRWTVPGLGGRLHNAGFDECDLLWIENPHLMHLGSLLRSRRLIVRVHDELRGFGHYPASLLDQFDAFVRKADVVVATAKSLHDRLEATGLAGRLVYAPNGVDAAHFQGAPGAKPPEYQPLAGRIVVYIGAVAGWFDGALLAECARRMPDTSFVIIGPLTQSAPACAGLPNVHLLGPRPYEQIPAYMRHADVGIIPFKPGLLVHAVNPLKLYEYMAAGLPVVATEWDELKQMNSPALLATDADGFCRQLQAAFGMKDDARWLRYAQANSWEHRFAQIMDAVEPLLRQADPRRGPV